MVRETPTSTKILTVLAGISFLIPLHIFIVWIYAFNTAPVHSERVDIFLSMFHGFFQLTSSVVFFSLFFCAAAIILSSLNLNFKDNQLRKLNLLILAGSAALLLFNIWQLL